jgi:phosphopantothenoylcysteine decarboxylase / phosphopantothenate---cysteine ligase
MIGAGRLADPETIVAATLEVLGVKQDLTGETILITAGPTHEPIDPVRYLTNRSSGKMGYAIAEAALRRNARVVLISGPTTVTPPEKAKLVRIKTAEEMKAAVLKHLPEASIVIKAAAVADYRVRQTAPQKMKRRGPLTLDLEPTADILLEIASRRTSHQVIIGFAAETEDVLENGRRKMQTKKLDAIVINDVSQPGIGFDADHNAVTIISSEEIIEIPAVEKIEIAQRVLDVALKLRKAERQLVDPV